MYSRSRDFQDRLQQAIAVYWEQLTAADSGYSAQEPASITYGSFFSDKMKVIKIIRAGLPIHIFELIRDSSPFSEFDWADFLDISTKTLQRYKASEDHVFKPIHSEKIFEIAEVLIAGLDVFGDMVKFRLWLHTPNFALGGYSPKDLLKDSYGKELLMSELIRIDHGILV